MTLPDHTQKKLLPFTFTGKTGEYFGIWIINLLLTIVTLGIYSAWAKVRNTQYIYSHTKLEDASFEYTANPIDILKGRIIAVSILVAYVAVSEFWPYLQFVFIIGFFIVLPFLLVASLRYRYRNSRYRNIRFNFAGSIGDAVKEFLLWPILILPTAGLIMPYIRYRQSKFLVDSSYYGNGQFVMDAKPSSFYMIFLKTIGLLLLGIVVLIGIIYIGTEFIPIPSEIEDENMYAMMSVAAAFLIYPLFGIVFLYATAKTRNLIYSSTLIESHSLESNVSARSLIFLWITNLLAIACTFGLAIPWVTIRMAKYYTKHTHFLADGDLDSFVQQQSSDDNAFGQEMADVLDLDLGL